MTKSAKRKLDRKLKKQERHARKAARKDQERMVYGISKDESWGKKSKKKRMKSGGVIIDFGSIHKLIKDFVKDVDGYHRYAFLCAVTCLLFSEILSANAQSQSTTTTITEYCPSCCGSISGLL